jgi:hypothetical protein
MSNKRNVEGEVSLNASGNDAFKEMLGLLCRILFQLRALVRILLLQLEVTRGELGNI